jgi:hypothetical protein
MKVSELIEQLKKCPQYLTVSIYYDGDARLSCDSAFYEKDFEFWNERKAEFVTVKSLVLCKKSDVYNKENAKWFFIKNILEMK